MWIVLFIWAIGANAIAYSSGYYRLPKQSLPKTPPFVTIGQLLGVFGIYLLVALLIVPIMARYILRILHSQNDQITTLPINIVAIFQVGTMLVIFLAITIFICFSDRALLGKIWKDKTEPFSFFKDFGAGILTWFLCFPLVTILGEGIEKIVRFIFGIKVYEQAAVRFMKLASVSPFSLICAMISVIVLAPLIEEFIFRGVLQTYLKKHLGVKAAILLSALAFALFHFYRDQGIGNISLILSLFFLGGYLGFIYERQASLWASIGLHMTFNTISALRIIFFTEI